MVATCSAVDLAVERGLDEQRRFATRNRVPAGRPSRLRAREQLPHEPLASLARRHEAASRAAMGAPPGRRQRTGEHRTPTVRP